MDDDSNARLDRIEKIIETLVRAQRDRNEEMAKAQRERDEAMAKAQRESSTKSEKRRFHHKCQNRRIDALVRRFVRFSVKDDHEHQNRMQALDATIKQLAAAQVVTEEKLQRFISSLSTNGFGSRT